MLQRVKAIALALLISLIISCISGIFFYVIFGIAAQGLKQYPLGMLFSSIAHTFVLCFTLCFCISILVLRWRSKKPLIQFSLIYSLSVVILVSIIVSANCRFSEEFATAHGYLRVYGWPFPFYYVGPTFSDIDWMKFILDAAYGFFAGGTALLMYEPQLDRSSLR